MIFLIIIWVESPETEWMAHDILHSSQSTPDLTLQVCMHEERGDDTRNQNGEVIGRDNLYLHAHLPDYESNHNYLNENKSASALEH